MGTRSLTVFEDEKGNEIVVMYRQFDGYPEGHGKELAEFLSGMKIVNGFTGKETKAANGMGCLAAQVVAYFKDGIGNIYLHPAGTRNCWEEYVYIVRGVVGEEPAITVQYAIWSMESNVTYRTIFACRASEYDANLEAYLNEGDSDE